MGKKTHLSKTLEFQGGIRYFNKEKKLLLTNKRWLKEHIRNNQLSKQLTWQHSYNSLFWKILELCFSFPQWLLFWFIHTDHYTFTPFQVTGFRSSQPPHLFCQASCYARIVSWSMPPVFSTHWTTSVGQPALCDSRDAMRYCCRCRHWPCTGKTTEHLEPGTFAVRGNWLKVEVQKRNKQKIQCLTAH